MSKKEEKKEVKNEKEEVKKDEVKKESNSSKTGLLEIVIVLIVVLVIACGVYLYKSKVNPDKEKELTTSLEKMGSEFYTDFYYTELSKNNSSQNVSNSLSKFKDTGIKINLDNLERYNGGKNEDEIAKFKNNGKECNKENTKAIIKPKSPYGKNDFTISVELDCGFSK